MLTWLNNDQYVVSWVQSNAAGAGGNDVKARIFQGGASPTPLTDIFSVNTTSAGNQQAPAITALPNGGFAIAWEDDSGIGLDGGPAIRLQAFDAAGGKVGGEIIVNTTTSGIQDEPSLAALPDGRIVVTWRDASATGGDTSGTAIRTQIVDPRDGVITGTPASETLYGNDLTGDEISAGAGNDVLNGLRGDDVLFGGEGNDVLNGGLGADDMYGGTGNDTYVVDNVGDTVTENPNEGIDTVRTTLASYTLGANVENLAFIGTGNFTGTGNALNNVITGGSGINTFNGGGRQRRACRRSARGNDRRDRQRPVRLHHARAPSLRPTPTPSPTSRTQRTGSASTMPASISASRRVPALPPSSRCPLPCSHPTRTAASPPPVTGSPTTRLAESCTTTPTEAAAPRASSSPPSPTMPPSLPATFFSSHRKQFPIVRLDGWDFEIRSSRRTRATPTANRSPRDVPVPSAYWSPRSAPASCRDALARGRSAIPYTKP